MKAALPGLAASSYVGTLQTWPCQGAATSNQSCPGSSLARGFACSLSPWGLEAVCHPDFPQGSNHILGPGLRSWPLLFLCTPTIGISLIQSTLAGWSRKVPVSSGLAAKGCLPAKTCYCWRAPSIKPPSQDGSLLVKKHKANVSSGLLGIFSAKSPISLKRNPEAGRPGGGGGGCESCCSTATTPGALQQLPACHNTGVSAEGFWQACHGGQDACFFPRHSLQHLQDPTARLPRHPGPPTPSHPGGQCVGASGLPLPFLLPSQEQVGCLHLHSAFFPPKVFFPHAPQPIWSVLAAPQAFCTLLPCYSQARASAHKRGLLLAHPCCCCFSDRISPGSTVTGASVAAGRVWW